MDQRMRFVLEYESGEEPMAALCRKYGISRRVGYKWFGRYLTEGPEGLRDRSRAPRVHRNQVAAKVEAKIIAARGAHPTWGPKKLLVLLEREYPGVWPARSTIAAILKRHGLTVSRKRRRRVPPHEAPFSSCDGPNAIWCADFKGWFRTSNGWRCDPLTISDAHSRYLLRCQVTRKTGGESIRPLFEATFREYGLPAAIRTDNGAPFASRAIGGLSALSVWWIKLGIKPERIDAGQPQQNGRHERMHLTLKNETANPPASNLRQQQNRFDAFRREYNEVRPHEALAMRTPGSCYWASPRTYPAKLDAPRYPDGWQLRRVCDRGEFRWKVAKVFLARPLEGELVGLEPVDGRYWRVWFGPLSLGILDSYCKRMVQRGKLDKTGLDESLLRSSFRCATGTSQEQ